MASNIKFYDDIHELWENSKIWRDYTANFGNTPYEFFTSIGFTFSGQNPLFQWEDGHRYFNNGANPIVLGGNGPRIVCCKLTKRGDATATEKYWVDLSNNTITIPTGKHYIDECNVLYDPLQLYLADNSTYFAHLEVGTNTTNTAGVGFTQGSLVNVSYNGITNKREIYSTSHYNLKTNSGTYNVRSIGKTSEIQAGGNDTPYQFKIGANSYKTKPIQFGYTDTVNNNLFPIAIIGEKDDTNKIVTSVQCQSIGPTNKAVVITHSDNSTTTIYLPDDAEVYAYSRTSPYYRSPNTYTDAKWFRIDSTDYKDGNPFVASFWGLDNSATSTIWFTLYYTIPLLCNKYNFSTGVWNPVTGTNRPGVTSYRSSVIISKTLPGDYRPDLPVYYHTGAYVPGIVTKTNAGWANYQSESKWNGQYRFSCEGTVEQNTWETPFSLANKLSLTINSKDNTFYLTEGQSRSIILNLEHTNPTSGLTFTDTNRNILEDTLKFYGTFNYTGVKGGFPALFQLYPDKIQSFSGEVPVNNQWTFCWKETKPNTQGETVNEIYSRAFYAGSMLTIDYAYENMNHIGSRWTAGPDTYIRRYLVDLEDCYFTSTANSYTSYAVKTSKWMLDKSATPVTPSSGGGGGSGSGGISIVDVNDPVNP